MEKTVRMLKKLTEINYVVILYNCEYTLALETNQMQLPYITFETRIYRVFRSNSFFCNQFRFAKTFIYTRISLYRVTR